MFSPDEVDLIRTSFAPTLPVGAKASTHVFDNLFDAYPDIQPLFSDIKGPPKSMFWATVGLIVDNLENLSSLDVPLTQLGERHVSFGATPERYGAFADIIIGTIATINGEDWTDAHEDAWETLFGHVVNKMRAGAERTRSSAA